MPHALISALTPLVRAQHPGLEHPYRIRRQRNQRPRYAGCEEVVCRGELVAASSSRAIVGDESAWVRTIVEEQELGFDDGFEVEEDGPTACVAHEVGRQASIEALDRSLIL